MMQVRATLTHHSFSTTTTRQLSTIRLTFRRVVILRIPRIVLLTLRRILVHRLSSLTRRLRPEAPLPLHLMRPVPRRKNIRLTVLSIMPSIIRLLTSLILSRLRVLTSTLHTLLPKTNQLRRTRFITSHNNMRLLRMIRRPLRLVITRHTSPSQLRVLLLLSQPSAFLSLMQTMTSVLLTLTSSLTFLLVSRR